MYYGIDLGTTNTIVSLYNPHKKCSCILSELIPSVVDLLTGEVGRMQKQRLRNGELTENILSSFKVDITMDTIGEPSINASALVLKECKKYMKYGGNEVVISVPAYFHNKQREATKRAARKAGLKVVSLVNEPTAAAIYYSREVNEKSVVYDLGGGTFDVTVIDTQHGISDIQATGGDKLGGDNLDEAICNMLCAECGVKLHRMTLGMKKSLIEDCEKLKLNIQKDRRTTVLDFSKAPYMAAFEKTIFKLTEEKYRMLVNLTFGSTINTMNEVVKSSGYSLNSLKLILVGGSTRDPYLIELIEQVKRAEMVTYNPDEIVAQGAAYYAYLIYMGLAEKSVSDITRGLGIELANGMLRMIIEPGSKIPISNQVLLHNSKATEQLRLELYQGDSDIAQENTNIGQLIYPFRNKMKEGKGIVLVKITVASDGTVRLQARESLSTVRQIELKVI